MADSSALQIPTTKSHNVQNANTRGRSSSLKRPLSGSDEQMKPPSSRQRSQSVTRKVPNPGSDKQVTFKPQGQSFDMCKLVETTMLKPEIIQTVVPTIIGEIKTELISELKSVIKSAVIQAIEDAIKPLQDCINKQNDKITSLKAENEQMKGKLNKRIEQMEDRYDKFRNMANVCPRILQEYDDLKHEVNILHNQIEKLEQYGRRTSLRFHNVPMTQGDLQQTDGLIVNIVNDKLGLAQPLTENDINRSHIIGPINNGKGQLICRFRNWKVNNSIFMKKKNLKNNKDNIFITEDLTKFRQSIIKELNTQKKAKKLNSFWTFDGRIFAKKTDDSRKTFIRCIQDFNDFIQ